MQEHNARFEAGEETWSRKVTPFYDHTMEEVAAILTLISKRHFSFFSLSSGGGR